jgi:DNA-3-methyladenine glycosylase
LHLPGSFYARPALTVARELLGAHLVLEEGRLRRVGRIVETEAYIGEHDLACHAAKGLTPRTEVLFGPPGRAYVYLIYGMHHCFNVVTAEAGVGEAVLVRALEPLEGLEEMKRRRGVEDVRRLCSGPGRLVQALGLGAQHDGSDLTRGNVSLLPPEPGFQAPEVHMGTRIGIRVGLDLALRFAFAN